MPWETDVETQVETLSDQIHAVLKAVRQPCGVAEKTYIDEKTWAWRSQKLSWRRKLKQTRTYLATILLRKCLHAWRRGQLTEEENVM